MLKEQHPFWSAWTRLVVQHPWAVICSTFAITAVFGVIAWRTPKDLSFTGIIPESDIEMANFRRAIDTFGSDTNVVMLLEGERREIDPAISALTTNLGALPQVKSITPPPDPEWLVDRAPWLWPRPLFDAAIEAARTGEALPALMANIEGADTVIRKSLRPMERASLLRIAMHLSPLDMAMGGDDYFGIERVATQTLRDGDFNVTFGFTGLGAAAAQDQRQIMSRIRLLSPVALIAVLLLLACVEPRLSRVAMAGVALSCSEVISLGLTGLVLGHLSILVTFFGVLLLGLGIDFAIHLLVALRDARSHGMSPEESVYYGMRHTATAIALGALTTGLAFTLVSMAPEAGARDMGLAAVFGMFSAFVLMLTFLPATWLLLERRHANRDAPPHFRLPGLRPIVALSLRYPGATAAVGLGCIVFGIAGIPRYELERDLEKIISRSVTSFDVDKRLEELLRMSPVAYIAPVHSLDEAREIKSKLLKLDEIAQVSSVADLLPTDANVRAELLGQLGAESLGRPIGSPIRERLLRARDLGPITIDTMPRYVKSGVVGPRGELAVGIVPKESTMDAALLAARTERIREVAPTATGLPIIIKLVAMGNRDYIPIIFIGILISVTFVLSLSFRDARDVALALAPVLVGSGATFGVFLWFNLHMSVLTSAVLPVILGLGVDEGIHVVERLRQYRTRDDATIQLAVESVGRAIFLTTATTCVSFVVLLFTNHAGLEGISWFMLLGMPLCLVASVTVLPAVAKLLARRTE